MQLILAIVADQQQAAQLAALIDGRLAVDLVQAAEVGEGLLALEDRIPDLILTSPLMSPFDDGVLDEYLRELGPAGAHVQTLRIPVLSQVPKKTTRLGFSLRRRAKPEATTPDGCEPKVFADEIAVYLARAAEDKRHASANDSTVTERGGIQDEVLAPPIAEEQWRPAYSADAVDEIAEWVDPEQEGEPASSRWRSDLLDRPVTEATPVYEPRAAETSAVWEDDTLDRLPVEEQYAPIYVPSAGPVPVEVDPTDVEPVRPKQDTTNGNQLGLKPDTTLEVETRVEEAIQLPPPAKFEERLEHETPVLVAAAKESPVEERAIIQTTVDERTAPPAVTRTAQKETAAPAIAKDDSHRATPSFRAALAAIRAAWGKTSAESSPVATQDLSAPARKEPGEPVADVTAALEVDLTAAVELLDEPATDPAPPAAVPRPFVPADSLETPEVYELSVEPDMNDVATSLTEPTGDSSKKPAKRAAKAAKAKSPPPLQPNSAQDEWGIFDPDRCGFAALVDKLDEVSDEKVKQRANGKGSKARVISCS